MLISIHIPHVFLDIQQKGKGIPYSIHPFGEVILQYTKTKAKRCNFTNDAATIRIFVKGLKNAHSLAMHIYEMGP